jgi:hypothetical protein
VHLAVIALLWWRRRELVYGVLVGAFGLLLAHSLRVLAPEARVGPMAAYWPLRVVAWAGAALGLGLLVSRRWRRRLGD